MTPLAPGIQSQLFKSVLTNWPAGLNHSSILAVTLSVPTNHGNRVMSDSSEIQVIQVNIFYSTNVCLFFNSQYIHMYFTSLSLTNGQRANTLGFTGANIV